jgi:vancomycin resistance protein YoaR
VYTYCYPEINFVDNLSDELQKINCKGEYVFKPTVYLNGIDEVIDGICRDVEREKQEPYVEFLKEGKPFVYYEGYDGATVNKNKLKADINYSINNDFCDVVAEVKNIKRVGNMPELYESTCLLYSFTTYFDGENTGRVHNIKLAAERINGSIINAGEVFSFNKTVGERTIKSGFVCAKIIEEGKFVEGVGGGVCQVSTTLYNAAMLSGLEIKEYHPHSLKVGYVPPSRDAMVSGNYCDLKIKNNRLTPIYVRMNVYNGYITCSIYGSSDGWKYSYLSQIISPDEGNEGEALYQLVSEGYLICEKDDIIKKKLVRRDKYGLPNIKN